MTLPVLGVGLLHEADVVAQGLGHLLQRRPGPTGAARSAPPGGPGPGRLQVPAAHEGEKLVAAASSGRPGGPPNRRPATGVKELVEGDGLAGPQAAF